MKPGKVPPDLLTRLVYPHLGRRSDVLVHAHLGEDCAVVDFDELVCVITCDPITAARHRLGWLAVHVACNDLATSGAEPVALLLTLLLKDGSSEEDLQTLMRDAGAAAASLSVEIVGGHTEITPGIDHTIAVTTAVGRAPKGTVLSAADAHANDAIILTKGAGIEGTAILASDLVDLLRPVIGVDALARAQRFIDRISVVPEGRISAKHGATAMHDVTEGGILAGVWELAEASGLGIRLRADAVPVLPETQAICHTLDLDPLALIGSGAMLIATPQPKRVLQGLSAAGIPAVEIGVITEDERIVYREGKARPLVPPERDELYRALENRGPKNYK